MSETFKTNPELCPYCYRKGKFGSACGCYKCECGKYSWGCRTINYGQRSNDEYIKMTTNISKLLKIVEPNILKWDHRFLKLAKEVSSYSKDPSTKVGAVITKDKRIVSIGFNGFPEGIEDTPERLNNREVKYQLVQHAEENAILFAETSLEGCTIYTWPFAPCSRCAGKIIQKRMKRVVYPKLKNQGLIDRWGKSLELTFEILKEANIETTEIDME